MIDGFVKDPIRLRRINISVMLHPSSLRSTTGTLPPAPAIAVFSGFAGQYFDQETGLHYNYHRYYEPATRRYLTPDPIGLAGGINLFAYTDNNPANWVDPYGLDPLTAAMMSGGISSGLGVGASGYSQPQAN